MYSEDGASTRSLVDRYQSLGGTQSASSVQKFRAIRSTETSVTIYQTTRLRIPEDKMSWLETAKYCIVRVTEAMETAQRRNILGNVTVVLAGLLRLYIVIADF